MEEDDWFSSTFSTYCSYEICFPSSSGCIILRIYACFCLQLYYFLFGCGFRENFMLVFCLWLYDFLFGCVLRILIERSILILRIYFDLLFLNCFYFHF